MKNIKRIAAIMLVLVMAFAMTACKKDNEIVGTWTMTGGAMVDMLAADMPEGTTLESLGIVLKFIFEDDGDFKMEMDVLGETESGEGSYEIDGNKVTMTIDGDPLTCEFKVDGDTLTLVGVEDFGGDMIFTRK